MRLSGSGLPVDSFGLVARTRAKRVTSPDAGVSRRRLPGNCLSGPSRVLLSGLVAAAAGQGRRLTDRRRRDLQGSTGDAANAFAFAARRPGGILECVLADPSVSVLAAVAPQLARHGRVALCQVVRVEGSTPGKLGWRLLVCPDGEAIGNLGGGAFEAMVQADALTRLRAGDRASGVERYYLTEQAEKGHATGMVCGGMVEVLLEVLVAAPTLVVCGGGPVGQALTQAGALAGFSLVVADDRADWRDPLRFPAGTSVAAWAPRIEVAPTAASDASAPAAGATPPGLRRLHEVLAALAGREVAVAVVTRCWETDLLALREVLGPPPGRLPAGAFYLGLMGSRRKIARICQELASLGYGVGELPLRAPIGLAVGGDTPGEIAIAVLAEILAVRHHSSLATPPRESAAASASGGPAQSVQELVGSA